MFRKVPLLIVSIVLAVSLFPVAAFAYSQSVGTSASVRQSVLTASAKKTYWYHVTFMPKSYGKGNNVAGCRAKVTKKAFKLTGRSYRATKLAKLSYINGYRGAKLLSKKTRTYKVAAKVTFYGSDWQASAKRKITRADALEHVKTCDKTRYGGLYFKVNGKSGLVNEIRLGA